jgi:hypothetical protein
MVDQKPPKLVADERDTVLALLQYQRDSFVRKMSGLSEDAAREVLVVSGTNPLWLTRHMAQAEALWVLRRFAGQDVDIPDGEVGPTDTMDSAIATYQETWRLVDEVVADTASLDELCRNMGDDDPVNLRWVLMHLLEETARHAGHADVLRELIDGQTGR